MYKKLMATVFLLAFVAQTFSAPFIRLDYYFNKADYAKNCVNKQRPKMHCNGQCQVMKKIQEEEKKERQTEERKLSSKVEVLSSKSFYSTAFTEIIFTGINIAWYIYDDTAAISMPRKFFHPPSF